MIRLKYHSSPIICRLNMVSATLFPSLRLRAGPCTYTAFHTLIERRLLTVYLLVRFILKFPNPT